MQTISFYSYKGGTGRSLALANAARYLARLKFSVVAMDLDLEAPGLHYKFSHLPDGAPLSVSKGVVDYIASFLSEKAPPESLLPYVIGVRVPGVDEPLLRVLPAGDPLSSSYWPKLTGINWRNLFYSGDPVGVPIFMELKSRIEDELKPDFLLVDSRTGITEMGGVATTLLADKAVCVVSLARENLDGARRVLQSVQRSRRENRQPRLETMIALSRVAQLDSPDEQRRYIDFVQTVLSEPALVSEDAFECSEVFLLHHEDSLGDSLRVGSGMSPDESVLLRDYLRLFASVVPAQAVASKIEILIETAKNKVWDAPDIAQKELEEFAQSFGRPEVYRALLHMYVLRNAPSPVILRTAEQLWHIAHNSYDLLLWETIQKHFRASPSRQRDGASVRSEFVQEVWRAAGQRDPDFAVRLADALEMQGHPERASDVLLEVIGKSAWTSAVPLAAIRMLDLAKRSDEADQLINTHRDEFEKDPALTEGWVQHALRTDNRSLLTEMVEPPSPIVARVNPVLALQTYGRLGMTAEATALMDEALRSLTKYTLSTEELGDLGDLFDRLGRWDEFENRVSALRLPPGLLERVTRRRNWKKGGNNER